MSTSSRKHEIKEAKTEAAKPFDIIYQAAKKHDAEAVRIINALLARTFCIDVQNGFETPVSKLAAENDQAAVNFLKDRFHASLHWIVYGYALGGHGATADNLLHQAPAAEQPRLRQWMAQGFAQGGHSALADALLHQAPAAEQPRLRQEMALGFARGGHGTLADIFLHQAPAAEQRHLGQWMAQGFAQGGHSALADALLHQAPAAEQPRLRQVMAFGYARSGHGTLADTLLHQAPAAEQRHLGQRMAQGFAQSGHSALADTLLHQAPAAEQPRLRQEMAFGFARGGHSALADTFLHQAPAAEQPSLRQWMAHGFAQGRHSALANTFLHQAPVAEQPRLRKWMAQGFALGGHNDLANTFLHQAPAAEQPRLRQWMAYNFAISEYSAFAINLLNNTPAAEQLYLLKIISHEFRKRGIFFDNRTTWKILGSVSNPLRTDLAKKFKDSKTVKFDVNTLLPKADYFYQLMQSQGFNVNQTLQWFNIDARHFFLYFYPEIYTRKLNTDLLFEIGKFLCPLPVSEAMDLSNGLENRLLHDRTSVKLSAIPARTLREGCFLAELTFMKSSKADVKNLDFKHSKSKQDETRSATPQNTLRPATHG